jgi:hypothetical protein
MNTVCGNPFNSTTRGPDSVECMSVLGSVADVMALIELVSFVPKADNCRQRSEEDRATPFTVACRWKRP